MMRRVVLIESPYSGNGTEAIRYLACCLLDSILRGEAPIASHAIYPLCLPERSGSFEGKTGREVGLECRDELAGLFQSVTDHRGPLPRPVKIVLYVDNGETSGMRRGHVDERRTLSGEPLRIWDSGEWPSEARWSRTNEWAQ